ncbi:MAG TPA: nitroreductase family protein [Treponemataceae bacterium]|nr:nitroreductase family protein [Treponemataceae bacterium]
MHGKKFEIVMHKRKAIRKFSKIPLQKQQIDKLLEFKDKILPLFPDVKIELKIISSSDIFGFVFVDAPHYLAVYAERTPRSDLNTGFIVEQFDLYFSANGIGSCWLGMNRPNQTEFKDLPFSIMLAFGSADEELHRTDEAQYKRKEIQEISSGEHCSDCLNTVRLAPSAMNKQPWYFSGDNRCIHAFSVKGKGVINLAESWRFVDLGIALCFLYISACSHDKNCIFKKEDAIPAKKGCEYVISCRLE